MRAMQLGVRYIFWIIARGVRRRRHVRSDVTWP
jgi:hypothetical protein